MVQGRTLLRITPAACIFLALSLILLPLDWMLSWLIALIVHEGAHILAVKFFNGRIHSIQFSLLGARILADDLTAVQQIVCSLAGPIGGLLLIWSKWLPQLAICACAQSICNLIPLWGFDGGRALHGCLCLWLPQGKSEIICQVIDRILRIVLCAFGLYTAWKLSWGLLAALSFVLLLRRIDNKNSLQTEPTTDTISLIETNEVRL